MLGTCYGYDSPNAVFSPNAVLLPNYEPCNLRNDSISHCCEIDHTCVTKGFCMTPSGEFYNGGCTDSSFKAAICRTFCRSGRLSLVDRSLLKLMVITGIANRLVQCRGSAVENGDFCCSFNRTITTCCNSASNGLGLIAGIPAALPVSARPDGASLVPTSVSAGIVQDLISSDATTSSSGSITGTYSTFEY